MINRVYIISKYFTVFPMFDPEELNSKINQSFKNQEKVEAEAQELENLFNSIIKKKMRLINLINLFYLQKEKSIPSWKSNIYLFIM